ncbi:hypothetical protein BD770DRAFT_75475 [Pilaira anomala]|nr:hypothetical protein BD770DRAFT_75475 [Pilaira anomala]
MSAGKLSVSPLTIHGLDQNGFPTSQTFIGCYVSQAEKQRTNSAQGPQPHFVDTLTYNVTEANDTLYLDVVNEDPSHPGLIGSGRVPLKSVIDSGRFEDWVPLQSSSGGHLGHLYMKLSYTASSSSGSPATTSPYGVPPTMNAAAPPTPTPTEGEQRDISGGAPPYNPNGSYTTGGGSAASFNPGAVAAAGAPLATPPLGTPPVAAVPSAKPKKEIPDWMKYGGAALAGGAAVGLGAWAINEFNSDEEEEEEAKQAYEAQQQQQQAQAQSQMYSENPYAAPMAAPQENYASRAMYEGEDEDAYEARRKEEEERYEERRKEEEERYQRHLEEMEQAVEDAEEAAEDAEEAAEEAEEAAEEAEEAAEEAEEAAEEAEEAAEEAEEAAEEAEEAAEEADEAAEEVEKLSIDDSKWR